MSLLSSLTLILLFTFCTTMSTLSYVGGTPIVNILLMLNIISPAILFFLISFQHTMPVLYMLLVATSFVVIAKDFRKISNFTRKYAIDYEIVIIALPVAASGALVGVLMKNLLSDLVIIILEIALMIYLLWRGFIEYGYVYEPYQPYQSN